MKIINNVVGNRYFVLEMLGKGGTSIVYKVRDIHTGKTYAMKRYITSDPANLKRLMEGMEQEIAVLKNCRHPFLPKIFDLIISQQHFFLIMEYVEGENLNNYMKSHGRFKKREALKIMEQVCSGLYFLHSLEPPVIYRDLKPSNIILKPDGNVKLIDFGIAKLYNRDIYAEYAFGSEGFAAPEQYGNAKGISIYNTDIRTDIYGIGTTMFYLLANKKYKAGEKSIYVRGKIKRIINKCTRINPNDRYQNCIEVLCHIKSLNKM